MVACENSQNSGARSESAENVIQVEIFTHPCMQCWQLKFSGNIL